ncbi:MAG: helix-turn-helix domain-containing protein [Roseburia sp.]
MKTEKLQIDSIIYDDSQMKQLMESIGHKIYQKRIEKGLSISKLAELSNLSVSCISKIETAQSEASLKAIIKIAAALDLSVSALFPDSEKHKQEEQDRTDSGKKFEQITGTAGEDLIDMILQMTEIIMQAAGRSTK